MRRQLQPIQPFGNAGFAFPQFAFPAFPQPGQGGQGTFVSSSQSLDNRFGGDEPVVSGQSSVVHHNNGQYHQTNTFVKPDGTVSTNHHSGE